MNKALLKITPQMLKKALGLKYEITHIFQTDNDKMSDCFSIGISGEDLPKPYEGTQYLYIPLEELLNEIDFSWEDPRKGLKDGS